MFRCPKCKFEQEGRNESWHEYLGFPFICQKCGEMFWIKKINEMMLIMPNQKIKAKIPLLKIGTKIYLNNADHKFYLSPGTIINKDHVHYRVCLRYHDGQLVKNTIFWCPENWIKSIPNWL